MRNRHERQTVRRALRWLGVLAGAILLAVVWLPFWWPPALKLALPRFGVQADTVERSGYTALQLRDVRFRFAGADFEARDIRLPQPTAWLWRRWLGSAKATNALVRLVDCSVVVGVAEPGVANVVRPPLRLGGLIEQAHRVAWAMTQWLPPLDLQDCRVRAAGREILVPELRWRAGRLDAAARFAPWGVDARLGVEVQAPDRLALQFQELSQRIEWQGDVCERGPDWELAGGGVWRDNTFDLRAHIRGANAGMWPDRLELDAPDITLPASFAGLPGYSNVVGSVRLAGVGEQFELRLAARAEPLAGDLPPLQLDVEARPDPSGMTVTRLDGRVAPLAATLLDPVTWHWATRQIDRPGRLALQADLRAQSWVDLRGQMRGEIRVMPGDGLEPQTEFRLVGEDIESPWLVVPALELAGRTMGRRMAHLTGTARWHDDSEIRVETRGVDPVARTVADAKVDLTIHPGGPLLAKWPFTFRTATARASLSGAWTNLHHHGAVALSGVLVDGLKEIQLDGRWEGEHGTRIAPFLTLATADGEMALAGSIEHLTTLTLTALKVRAFDEPPLALCAPMRLRLQPPTALDAAGWKVEIGRLALTNALRQFVFEGQWQRPDRLRGCVAVTNLDTRVLSAFLTANLPAIALESLAIEVSGGFGPAAVRAAATGWWEPTPNLPARIVARIEGDERGLRIDDLRISECDVQALRLDGRVPLVCGFLETGRLWHLSVDQPFELDFSLTPTPTLQRIGLERLGMTATDPRGNGRLAGTLAAPVGQVRLLAADLRALTNSPLAGWLPRLEALDMTLHADADRVRLEPLRLEVDGAPLTVSATLPATTNAWMDLLRGRSGLDLAGLEGRARLDALPVAQMASRFVAELRSEGELSADLRLRPGWKWAGRVEFGQLGTRPLPWVGPLRNLHGCVVLEDRQARLDSAAADIGGSTVRLTGWVDLPAGAMADWRLPAFDLHLGGTEVALIREADLVLRGDLDLRLRHDRTGAPLLDGAVTLGRGFVLSDLEAMLGSRMRVPTRPPPFLSVTQEPFAAWRLGVDLRGDECLHVRSPFYNGVHSVNLRLRGTLREPMLLGDAQVVRGNLVFPYATLPMRQGLVTFAEADPARPRLQASAGARAFGYDLRLEASGSVLDPVVRFSSSPPLSSEEVLLMITAGELPRNQRNTTTANRLSKLAFLFGKDLVNKLGAGGDGEGHLTYRTGERVSARGKVTRRLEYRLNDSWSLVGEYDEFDELNAGVKWRVLRR